MRESFEFTVEIWILVIQKLSKSWFLESISKKLLSPVDFDHDEKFKFSRIIFKKLRGAIQKTLGPSIHVARWPLLYLGASVLVVAYS